MGGGEDGKRCLGLLKRANVKIECVYDSNTNENQFLFGIIMRKPLDHEIKEQQSIIIIATKAYEQKVANKLESLGLKRKIEFLLFDELEQEFIKQYYRAFTRFFAERKLLFEAENGGIPN